MPYGLLEIKCPTNEHITDIKYIQDDKSSTLQPVRRLSRSHEYYYQLISSDVSAGCNGAGMV